MAELPSWEDQTRPLTHNRIVKGVFSTLGTLVFYLIVGIGIWIWWSGDDNSHSGNVLEIKCVENTGFDDKKLCLKPDRPGAEVAFRVNESTGKVLITIVRDDPGNPSIKDIFLEHCSVVDKTNWKCNETMGKPEGPFYMVTEYGMVHGRYYHSLTGDPIGAHSSSGDFYTSSISGRTFLALENGSMDMPTAMIETGYLSQESYRSAWTGYSARRALPGKPCDPDCIKEITRRLK